MNEQMKVAAEDQLRSLLDRLPALSSDPMDQGKLARWQRDVRNALARSFGERSLFCDKFAAIAWAGTPREHQRAFRLSFQDLQAAQDEVDREAFGQARDEATFLLTYAMAVLALPEPSSRAGSDVAPPTAESGADPQAVDLFLAHSGEDGAFVKALADGLSKRGLNAWFFEEHQELGSNFIRNIAINVPRAQHFAAVISRRAIGSDSPWLSREIDYAARTSRTIVPVFLGTRPADLQPKRPEWDFVLGALVGLEVQESADPQTVAAEIARRVEQTNKSVTASAPAPQRLPPESGAAAPVTGASEKREVLPSAADQTEAGAFDSAAVVHPASAKGPTPSSAAPPAAGCAVEGELAEAAAHTPAETVTPESQPAVAAAGAVAPPASPSSGEPPPASSTPDVQVRGDFGLDRFVYVRSSNLNDGPPNLRDTWVQAGGFDEVLIPGGAGAVVETLRALGFDAGPRALSPADFDPDAGNRPPPPAQTNSAGGAQGSPPAEAAKASPPPTPGYPKSVHLLVQDAAKPGAEGKTSKPAADSRPAPWRVGQSLVAGERAFAGEPRAAAASAQAIAGPLVLVDFRQGYRARLIPPEPEPKRKESTNEPPGAAASSDGKPDSIDVAVAVRTVAVRTHDPSHRDWQRFRSVRATMTTVPCLWFAPIQDMAEGALRFPGIWQDVRQRVRDHLRADPTLWREGRWLHHVVIQLYEEGALVFPADTESGGYLVHAAGTQPKFPKDTPPRLPVMGGGILLFSACCGFALRSHGAAVSAAAAHSGRAAAPNPTESVRALLHAAEHGLRALRQLSAEGYAPPQDAPADPGDAPRILAGSRALESLKRAAPALPLDPPRAVSLSVAASAPAATGGRTEAETAKRDRDPIILDPAPGGALPAPDAERAILRTLVAGDELDYRAAVKLSLGKLVATSDAEARTLVRLASPLDEYLRRPNQRVFSFAVFGGPGSGKSFLAKELARHLQAAHAADDDLVKTFNLAQFSEPRQLAEAFRWLQNRNAVRREAVPFVIWDEFDTHFDGRRCGWLPRFLMPMEDGAFVDDHREWKLGQAVFVFVGGSFSDDAEFTTWAFDAEQGVPLKGRDFRSRLASVVTVASVDRERRRGVGDERSCERTRAMLIRAALSDIAKDPGHPLRQLDSRVFDFLLRAPLAHGARSLRHLLTASTLSHTDVFRPWHLPSEETLRLHVGPPSGKPATASSRAIWSTLRAPEGDVIPLAWRSESKPESKPSEPG